ncbi:hypothetical protein PR048_006179 [Dryococelus australis]|uniref:Uncharacterized protein n=1 Tax=Dryococelus australis TaxID=614101 RepID=A0ABQ9IA99_9NEOP|nr:hypothetical protein PR048_006179 [Dryococelus australis]
MFITICEDCKNRALEREKEVEKRKTKDLCGFVVMLVFWDILCVGACMHAGVCVDVCECGWVCVHVRLKKRRAANLKKKIEEHAVKLKQAELESLGKEESQFRNLSSYLDVCKFVPVALYLFWLCWYALLQQCLRLFENLKFDGGAHVLTRHGQHYSMPRGTGFNLWTGRSRIFTSGNRFGLCRWSADFLWDFQIPPFLHSSIAPFSPHFTLIGSQDLFVRLEQHQNARVEEREIPEKTHRPMAWSGMIPTCKNLGVTQPGFESGSVYWEVSSLTAQPPQPPFIEELGRNQPGPVLRKHPSFRLE